MTFKTDYWNIELIMEDRSFYWLLSLLAKKASSLDVLDTYVTLDQKPSYFYTKENSKLLTKTSENMSFNDLLHKVYQEYI